MISQKNELFINIVQIYIFYGILDIIASLNNGKELKWNENLGQFNFKSHLISGQVILKIT